MTLKECYAAMGGDYENVISRLRKDDRVKKFLVKVVEDQSYALLCSSMEAKDMQEAFRAAHTLKGICQNLSLDSLLVSVDRLCERLRGVQDYSPDMEPLFEQVKRDYARITECIRML